VAVSTRELGKGDLDQVVAIDRAITGRSRRHFFEKRLTSADKRPSDAVHVGLFDAGTLRGFAIAHVLRGEFGRTHDVMVLDSLGVASEVRGRGFGRTLMESVVAAARQRGAKSVQSQVEWGDADLLRFFHASRFTLSSNLALERPAGGLAEQAEQEP
jgi:GNAT superfamily N-acetyltransferase